MGSLPCAEGGTGVGTSIHPAFVGGNELEGKGITGDGIGITAALTAPRAVLTLAQSRGRIGLNRKKPAIATSDFQDPQPRLDRR